MHEYCPPEHVQAEMDRLLEMSNGHDGARVHPEVQAAWLHRRFTQIHPFQDGNGRIARALASLVFLKAEWFPLVIDRDTRADYIEALEMADRGDLEPLVRLFADMQKRSFLAALSIFEDVLHARRSVNQVIDSAAQRLRDRREGRTRRLQEVFQYSSELEDLCLEHLRETGNLLDPKLKGFSDEYAAAAQRSYDASHHWYKNQIVTLAMELGYYANTQTYRSWVRLRIVEDRQTEMVVSFHGLGFNFVGSLVASAFIMFRDSGENGESMVDGPYKICKDLFQFSYNETAPDVRERFEKWLEDVIVFGLDEWRRQL
ncbi:Fic family protein [Thermodesulfobacteriota bacterium]